MVSLQKLGRFLYWRAHRAGTGARDWVRRRAWEARALRRAWRPRRGKGHNLPGELIISLTSYPARFRTLHLTLACLLDQTVRPARVILWIAHDDRVLLPRRIARLDGRGLEIRTCADLRSYKKLIPALEAFPDAFIATADDDTYYPSGWLEKLVAGADGSTIACHRAHRLVLDEDDKLAPYLDWDFDVQDSKARKKSIDLVPTGVGGVLYPPHSLHPMVTDRALFQALCPDGDDLWFYWCARMAGTGCRKVGGRMRVIDWEGTRDTALWNSNARGGNDRMIRALQARFPSIELAFNSAEYWESRYSIGGTSGAGSYNRLAEFKANVLNDFVEKNDIHSIIEFGSGDGAQLEIAKYPSYVGVDLSPTVVDVAKARFRDDPSKQFLHLSGLSPDTRAELSLSLDVIYHLVEDDVFEEYMRRLFDAAMRYVIIYASNHEDACESAAHVRHRCFSRWVEAERPDFALVRHIPNEFPFDENDQDNTSFADFYIFRRT